MKKIFKVLLFGIIAIVVLQGCSKTAPESTKKEGSVSDSITKDSDVLENVFSNTFSIKINGEDVGAFFIGSPILTHNNSGNEEFIEIKIPLKLTNLTNKVQGTRNLLIDTIINGQFKPYTDALKVMIISNKKIISGNTSRGNEEFFVNIFNENLDMKNGEYILNPREATESYYKYIITKDDVNLNSTTKTFESLNLSDFNFVIASNNEKGYTVVK